MTTYEVRVTQTHVDYYHIDANSKEEATALIRQHVIEDDCFMNPRKVDTIKRTPEVDYALELTKEGEVIL